MPAEYTLLPSNGVSSRWQANLRQRKTTAALSVFFVLIVLWATVKFFTPKPPFSFQKSYQDLGPPPLVDGLVSSVDPKKTAVVSTLYTDSFIWGAAVLAHSVRRHNITSRLLLPYLENRVSDKALCIARAAGWEPMVVPSIPPPHNGQGIHHRFSDQYTKLNIWSLDTSHGIERAVYLDSDTLVRKNFNELFNLPFTFAAAPDVYTDDRGFPINFNAGMLAFRPSTELLDHMKAVMEEAVYPLQQAEQSFLNLFFAANAVRLPYVYNGNLAIKKASPAMWRAMDKEMRIVHYTMVKPFVREHSGKVGIPTQDELREIQRESSERDGGFYREEVEWWSAIYYEMMGDRGEQINKCLQS